MNEFTLNPAAPLEDAKTVKIVAPTPDGGSAEHRYTVMGMTLKASKRLAKMQKQVTAAKAKAATNGGIKIDVVLDQEARAFIMAIGTMLRPVNGAPPAADVLAALWEDESLELSVQGLQALFQHIMGSVPDPPD